MTCVYSFIWNVQCQTVQCMFFSDVYIYMYFFICFPYTLQLILAGAAHLLVRQMGIPYSWLTQYNISPVTQQSVC